LTQIGELKSCSIVLKGGGIVVTSRVEQCIIRKSHPLWGVIDEMCFKAKNLYNYANYILRQEFLEHNQYISYRQMNKELKAHDEYKQCMSQPANCILRLLDKNWKSFFCALKAYESNPKKFLGRPQIPKYLKKDGRFNWMIPNNACYFENGELKFRVRKLQSIKWKCRCVGRLIQVRFVPRGCVYVMEIVSEVEVPDVTSENKRIVGIDLGVNNLVTASNNIGEPPFIINGRGLKSINQFYNKRKSKLQSGLPKEQFWSKQLDNLTFKRYCRIKNYMHHTSRKIIDWMRKHNIDTLVIGHNKKWKQKCYLNNFVQIPYNILINQLIYKCEENNIRCVVVEESYTSGTSFVDGETPCKENYSKNRRICRGLFQSSSQLINADVNGSLQIIKKVFPNAFDYGVEANLTPTIINACLI
jgi:putative transposase